MQFVLTFLAYFLLGLMAGTLFEPQVRLVMDNAIIPAVEDTYDLIKSEIMKTQGNTPGVPQKVSSTVEIQAPPQINMPTPIGIDKFGYEVYEDENGYYVIDDEDMKIPVLDEEIQEFYGN